MRRILIYGDSNVWGDNFSGPRVPYRLRWPSRLQYMGGVHVLADGVPGRVAGDYRDDKPDKNGKSYYLDALSRAGDVDVVIIALGTNDLQVRYARTKQEIIDDLLWYRGATSMAGGPEVLYVLPAQFSVDESSGPEFTEESLRLREEVVRQKHLLGWHLVLDKVPLSDGLHFSIDGHKIVAQLVHQVIKES